MTEEKPKTEEGQDEIATVTLAEMAVIDDNKPINLPYRFIEALSPEEATQAIIILAPNTKIIRIIPTESDTVAKININIGKLSPDFLRQMGSIFIRLGIKTLFSTGLCFTSTTCVYEGYLDSTELETVSVGKIYEEFKAIPGVSTVTIDMLTVNKD
jgi:hypothetical protein